MATFALRGAGARLSTTGATAGTDLAPAFTGLALIAALALLMDGFGALAAGLVAAGFTAATRLSLTLPTAFLATGFATGFVAFFGAGLAAVFLATALPAPITARTNLLTTPGFFETGLAAGFAAFTTFLAATTLAIGFFLATGLTLALETTLVAGFALPEGFADFLLAATTFLTGLAITIPLTRLRNRARLKIQPAQRARVIAYACRYGNSKPDTLASIAAQVLLVIANLWAVSLIDLQPTRNPPASRQPLSAAITEPEESLPPHASLAALTDSLLSALA